METPVFHDKSKRPKDADLAKVLGRAKRYWDDLVAQVGAADDRATVEWKYYATGGWRLVARDRRRNLVYLKPSAKGFTASFAFGDKAVEAAEQSDLPEKIVKPIHQSPKYPEGRAVRIDVGTASAAKIAAKLLAIKMAN